MQNQNTNSIQSYNGLPIVDSNSPNVVAPCPLSVYSTLSVTSYWRAVNFLSDNMASFPRSVTQDKTRLDVPHPLDKLLRRTPNSYQNATQFWRTLYYHKSHSSNAYAEIKRTPTGRPESLHNLLPENVFPFRYDDGKNGLQQFYFDQSTKRILPYADVLFLSGLSHDGMIGIDHLRLFGETFQKAKSQERYQTRFILKGTIIRGAIELPQGIEPKQQEAIVSTLRTYFQGADAERDVIVLSDGAKLSNATLSPQESQLIEQIAYTTKQIAQITGVPPEFLYEFAETKYLNTIEAVGQNVIRFTFLPFIVQAEDELTTKLLSEADQDAGFSIRLDTSALLRGDTQAQNTIAIARKAAGITTTNEARAELGLSNSEDPDADKLKILGDTTPQAQRALPAAPQQHSDEKTAANTYATLKPIIDAAIERIEDKTAKAFANAEKKEPQAKIIWGNVFASQQEQYVIQNFQPIADAMKEMGLPELDLNEIAQRYSAQVRRRNATHEPTDLNKIITTTGEKNESE